MIEREKVIKGLECCVHDDMGDCDNCPYNDDTRCCDTKLMRDAITLLKAQEPPTNVSISSAIECLLHPQDADDSDMAKAIDTAVHALRLLKAHEPIRPNEIWQGNVLVYYQCSACTSTLLAGDKYCAWCGRKVKWE